MRLTRYFLPVLKETPSEAQIASHRLMLRAGLIKQASAGIYSWLPLGYKVLKRIEQIVHEEQIPRGAYPHADAHAAIGRSVARIRGATMINGQGNSCALPTRGHWARHALLVRRNEGIELPTSSAAM